MISWKDPTPLPIVWASQGHTSFEAQGCMKQDVSKSWWLFSSETASCVNIAFRVALPKTSPTHNLYRWSMPWVVKIRGVIATRAGCDYNFPSCFDLLWLHVFYTYNYKMFACCFIFQHRSVLLTALSTACPEVNCVSIFATFGNSEVEKVLVLFFKSPKHWGIFFFTCQKGFWWCKYSLKQISMKQNCWANTI